MEKLKKFVKSGDFTLKRIKNIREEFCKVDRNKIRLWCKFWNRCNQTELKSFRVKAGDEVITAANTFVATVGAITEIGAKPVFVDCDDTFCMNVDLLESKITKKTKAIVPVHFTGYMVNMIKLSRIAKKYRIPIVEDACQSILGSINKKNAGGWGELGAFSLHPLKNINVWSDGGIITTNSKKFYNKLYY